VASPTPQPPHPHRKSPRHASKAGQAPEPVRT
jgi:hypothetical protein